MEKTKMPYKTQHNSVQKNLLNNTNCFNCNITLKTEPEQIDGMCKKCTFQQRIALEKEGMS